MTTRRPETEKPKAVPLHIRVPDDLMHRVKIRLAERRRKLTPLVVELLEAWLRRRT